MAEKERDSRQRDEEMEFEDESKDYCEGGVLGMVFLLLYPCYFDIVVFFLVCPLDFFNYKLSFFGEILVINWNNLETYTL